MSAAPDLPISDAREHLADVVNKATYAGSVTYLTRRGRRVAAIVPVARAAADEAKATELAVVQACRVLWESVRDADEATRARVREAIDRLVSQAEDAADIAAADAARAEIEAGAPTTSLQSLKDELGL